MSVKQRLTAEFVRSSISLLCRSNERTALSVAAMLKEAGAVAGAHVGAPKPFTPEQTLEWYAGQAVSVVEKRQWYAVNAICNTCEKFTGLPLVDE